MGGCHASHRRLRRGPNRRSGEWGAAPHFRPRVAAGRVGVPIGSAACPFYAVDSGAACSQPQAIAARAGTAARARDQGPRIRRPPRRLSTARRWGRRPGPRHGPTPSASRPNSASRGGGPGCCSRTAVMDKAAALLAAQTTSVMGKAAAHKRRLRNRVRKEARLGDSPRPPPRPPHDGSSARPPSPRLPLYQPASSGAGCSSARIGSPKRLFSARAAPAAEQPDGPPRAPTPHAARSLAARRGPDPADPPAVSRRAPPVSPRGGTQAGPARRLGCCAAAASIFGRRRSKGLLTSRLGPKPPPQKKRLCRASP